MEDREGYEALNIVAGLVAQHNPETAQLDSHHLQPTWDSGLNGRDGAYAIKFICPLCDTPDCSKLVMAWFTSGEEAERKLKIKCFKGGCPVNHDGGFVKMCEALHIPLPATLASILGHDFPADFQATLDKLQQNQNQSSAEQEPPRSPAKPIQSLNRFQDAVAEHAQSLGRPSFIAITCSTDGKHYEAEIRYDERQESSFEYDPVKREVVTPWKKRFTTVSNDGDAVRVGKIEHDVRIMPLILNDIVAQCASDYSEGGCRVFTTQIRDMLKKRRTEDRVNPFEGRTAVVVEGPKTAIRLRMLLEGSYDFDIVCGLRGSDNVSQHDWSSLLLYDRVIIAPDHDAAGRKYYQAILKQLSSAGKSSHVEVIDWHQFPGIRQKGDDFCDLLQYAERNVPAYVEALYERRHADGAAGEFPLERGSTEQPNRLARIAEYILKWASRVNITRNLGLSEARSLEYHLGTEDRTEQLVPGLIHRNGQRVYVTAKKKAGKSTIMMRMALDLAAGQPVFGMPEYKPTRPLNVLMITNEDSAKSVAMRIKGMAEALGGEYCEGGRVKRSILQNIHPHPTRINLKDKDFLKETEKAAYTRMYDVVMIDPLYKSVDYDAANMASFGKAIESVQDAFGDSVLILSHHFRKHGQKSNTIDWTPGSSDGSGAGMDADSAVDILLHARDGEHDGPSKVNMTISGRLLNGEQKQLLYQYDPNTYEFMIPFLRRREAESQGLIPVSSKRLERNPALKNRRDDLVNQMTEANRLLIDKDNDSKSLPTSDLPPDVVQAMLRVESKGHPVYLLEGEHLVLQGQRQPRGKKALEPAATLFLNDQAHQQTLTFPPTEPAPIETDFTNE